MKKYFLSFVLLFITLGLIFGIGLGVGLTKEPVVQSPVLPLKEQLVVTNAITLRINVANGFRPQEWEMPLRYFEQDYAVVGRHNGKRVYENFSFLNKNSENRARIIWDRVFDRPAWIVQGTRYSESQPDSEVSEGSGLENGSGVYDGSGFDEGSGIFEGSGGDISRVRRARQVEPVDDPIWNVEQFVSWEDVPSPGEAEKWVYFSGVDTLEDTGAGKGELLSLLRDKLIVQTPQLLQVRGTEIHHTAAWTVPALFFDQNYRVAGKHNSRFAFESFSFAADDESNTAEIVFDFAFGQPAWVMRSMADPAETRFYSREDVTVPNEIRMWKHLPSALAVELPIDTPGVTANEIESKLINN